MRVTLRDIYDGLQALRDDVRPLVDGVAVLQKETVPDHERRIRTLEKWAYALPPTFILALVSVILRVK